MNHHVIIIGGGVAGLNAALYLASQNIAITLLEARVRMGGRIFTVKASDNKTPIELGASYWEGVASNPFYQQYFAPTKDDPLKPYTQLLLEEDNTIVDLRNKSMLSPSDINKYYQFAKYYLARINENRLGKTYEQIIEACDLSQHSQEGAYWIKKIMEWQSMHQSTPLSLVGFPEFKIPQDEAQLNAYNDNQANFCFVGNGYDRVVQQMNKACLAAGVSIITNSPVTKILDKGSQGVTVQTHEKGYHADKIISTIPLGVLKTQARTLFTPPLSPEKLQAIDAMGVHESTRVVMEFEKPFWPHENSPYLLLCSEDKKGMKEFRNNHVIHQKAILQSPSYAKEAKNRSDETLVKLIHADLSNAFSSRKIPFPINYFVYRWSEDPFAQGAYPYRTLSMDEKKHCALAKPEGNIYFAGADFSRHGFSVHHAWASGKEVAVQLMMALKP